LKNNILDGMKKLTLAILIFLMMLQASTIRTGTSARKAWNTLEAGADTLRSHKPVEPYDTWVPAL